ncbi:MAG: RagB/SusD family nutrient uptake outer membrane protein [Chitinophagaceae bacterium]
MKNNTNRKVTTNSTPNQRPQLFVPVATRMNNNPVYRRSTACLLFILFFLSISSCKKLVESDPPSDYLTDISLYKTDATAIAVLNGIYIAMNGQSIQGRNSIGLLAGLSGDELNLYNGVADANYQGYYYNALTQPLGPPQTGTDSWSPLYNLIFTCNAALDGLGSSTSLTPIVKQQLVGEAKFLRAFFYFYLLNLFGDLPLVLTTDPKTNTLLARSSKAAVYQQIITDLNEAETNLSDNFLNGTLLNTTTERVRPTKWAATALMARVYLYLGNLTGDASNYVKAGDKASAIINNNSLFGPLPALNNVFLKNSREAIWQSQPTDIDFNTTEAQTLIITSFGPSDDNPVYLSSDLLTSFETGDQRAINGNWINSETVGTDTYYFPYKYKINTSPGVTDAAGMTEYFMMLRLGEQYLIRSEASARQGNIGGAQSDLNTIRNRAGLVNTTAGDQTSLLAAILNERRHELFSEWGHRWLDLKRTGTIDAVMTIVTPQKANGAPWQSYQQLYPLPRRTDLNNAPNLVQNPGY